MKLEVGMYVRTDDGYIAKYDKSKHNCSGKYYGFASTIRDLRWEEYDDDCFLWESELKSIVKASYNIIDILEVGDYVNGSKVMKTHCKLEYIDDDSDTGVNEVDDGLELENGWIYFEYEVETIVTHEQMEQMSYKVGGGSKDDK